MIRALWSDDPAAFSGRFAEFGDVVDMSAVHDQLAELGDEVGRDPDELELSVVRGMVPPGREEESFIPDRRNLGGSASEMVEELGRYAEAGVSLVAIQLSLLAPLMPEDLEWFASEVMSQLDGA